MTSAGQPCPCPPPPHSHQREAGSIPPKVTGQQVAVLRPALPSHPRQPPPDSHCKPQVSWAIRNLPGEAWSFSSLLFLGLFSRFSNSRLLQKPPGACTGTFFFKKKKRERKEKKEICSHSLGKKATNSLILPCNLWFLSWVGSSRWEGRPCWGERSGLVSRPPPLHPPLFSFRA